MIGIMVWSLFLPIVLSAIALFFASFLSWMVVKLHKPDWKPLPNEDDVMQAAKEGNLPVGSYVFPHCSNPEEMKSEAYKKKMLEEPSGVMTIFPRGESMGRNLGLTFALFLGVSFCIGYLATLALEPGAGFNDVFRFVATAGIVTFLVGIVQHAIWFRIRIVGHVIESVVYALIMALIFAAFWPAAS